MKSVFDVACHLYRLGPDLVARIDLVGRGRVVAACFRRHASRRLPVRFPPGVHGPVTGETVYHDIVDAILR